MLGDVPGLMAGVTMRVLEYGAALVLGKVGSAVAWLGRLWRHRAQCELKKHNN